MKTDEPRDDEILGRALSRAIETAEVNETPYDHSRIGARPLKRGTPFWRVAALAATIVVAGALGSTLLERPAIDGPVAQQPTPTTAVNTPAATVTPARTPDPSSIDRQRVYTWRDGLAPASVHLDSVGTQPTAAERISARVNALNNAVSGIGGTILLADPKQLYVAGVTISGDTATIDYSAPIPLSGSLATSAMAQQIVYTATEEPGIRRVLVTVKGKPATIDQIVWDRPLTRDDVSGYGTWKDEVISEDQSRPCAPTCPSPSPAVLSNNYSVDTFAAGVARFVVQVDSGDWETFTVSGKAADDTKDPTQSKYQLVIQVKGTERKPGLEIIDRSPLRSIRSTVTTGATQYELALDDQRPWRVALLKNPDRIIVDVGGFARSISDTVAVYSPTPIAARSGASLATDQVIGHQFTVSGLSRTFEATTAWRVVDSTRRVLADGATTASRGTSAVWGTYQISVQLPANASGNVTLEVYWASPRDGADTGLVQVPLVVR
jgi:immunoglobulin-like protein involved in spore germination/sporulation and spore germination protein